ncbi:hypothetical protein ACNKU7_00885 [Microbulbifer sp. SA54]|uniref:hypothetical protein n=1 Tax=Microbulbifer sp. SA54 TaxID=3401577 RepID=UPI003AAFB39E
MKRIYGGLAGTIGAAALLTLSGCSSMQDMTSTTTAINTSDRPGYYSVQGRYYHCHQDGRCHNVRHPNYYWQGGQFRGGSPSHYHRYPQQPR